MHSASDKLRVIARAMPFSLPPLEAAGLVLMMVLWLFG
jgi:hypothetical protein